LLTTGTIISVIGVLANSVQSKAGLLVKLQDDHPVNKMICMDFHGFPFIWFDLGL
jgi:hypothetical protein